MGSENVKDAKNTEKSPLFAALDYFEAENLEFDVCTNNTTERRCPQNSNVSYCPNFNSGECNMQHQLSPRLTSLQTSSISPRAHISLKQSSLFECSICNQALFGNQHNCQNYTYNWSMLPGEIWYVSHANNTFPLLPGRYYRFEGYTSEKRPQWKTMDMKYVVHSRQTNWNIRLVSMDPLIQDNIKNYVENDKLKIEILIWILKNTPRNSSQFNEIKNSNALLRIMKLPMKSNALKKLVELLVDSDLVDSESFGCDALLEENNVNAIHLAVKRNNTEVAEILYQSLARQYGRSMQRNHLIQYMNHFLAENKIAKNNQAYQKLKSLRKKTAENFGKLSSSEHLYETLLSWNTDFYSIADTLSRKEIDGNAFISNFDNLPLQEEPYKKKSLAKSEQEDLIQQLIHNVDCALESTIIALPDNQLCRIDDHESFVKNCNSSESIWEYRPTLQK